jgi:hypothetical protein
MVTKEEMLTVAMKLIKKFNQLISDRFFGNTFLQFFTDSHIMQEKISYSFPISAMNGGYFSIMFSYAFTIKNLCIPGFYFVDRVDIAGKFKPG